MMVNVYSNMNLNELKAILKKEVKDITLTELHQLSLHFHRETQFLPKKYKEEYTNSVQNVMISRILSLKNDDKDYKGNIEQKDIKFINELLGKKEDIVTFIMNISVIYTTFFLIEPIHNIKTVFPGTKSIYQKGKYYYCPVKKYHINSKKSLCKYCIAKLDED